MIDMKMLETIFCSFGPNTTYDIEMAWLEVLLNADARRDAIRWLRCNDNLVYGATNILRTKGVCDDAAQTEALMLMAVRLLRQIVLDSGATCNRQPTPDVESSAATSADGVERHCCCLHSDARACFLARHPECRRFTDDVYPLSNYERTLDDQCECSCHYRDDDDEEPLP